MDGSKRLHKPQGESNVKGFCTYNWSKHSQLIVIVIISVA
jgi:hypothetical protein